jgi:hypothetical protein
LPFKLETLKVVIGVTTPAQANGCVDQENNTLNAKTNGHITSKPEVQKALTNGAFEWQEGSGSEAVTPITTFSVSSACRCTAFSCGFAKRDNRNIFIKL